MKILFLAKAKLFSSAAVKKYAELILKVRVEVTGSILTAWLVEIRPSSYNAT